MKKRAFTLAETLITLSIIGVVAVLTITTFVKNYQEKAWKTSAEVFDKKLTDAIDLMNTNDELAGYSTTEDFVNAFSKYTKIIKTCDESNIDKCWHSGGTNKSNSVTIFPSAEQCSSSSRIYINTIKAVKACSGLKLGIKESRKLVDDACAGTPQTIECNFEPSLNELVSYGATAKYSDVYKLKKLEFSKYVIEPSYDYNQINRKEKATTSVMGAVFADGTQALIIYNENCEKIDLKHSECVGIMYDTSGLKKPNYIGKDRGILIK